MNKISRRERIAAEAGDFLQGLRNRQNALKQKEGPTEKLAPLYQAALGVTEILVVPVDLCRHWPGNDRAIDLISPEKIRALAESIEKEGQIQPAIGRVRRDSVNDESYIEIVAGSMRLEACRYASTPIKVAVSEDMDDRQAYLLQDAENLRRMDISVYERAVSYQAMRDSAFFPTDESMAEALGVSKGYLSKLRKIANVPREVFVSIGPEKFTLDLGIGFADFLKVNPDFKSVLIEKANSFSANTGEIAIKHLLALIRKEEQRSPRVRWQVRATQNRQKPLELFRFLPKASGAMTVEISDRFFDQREAILAIIQEYLEKTLENGSSD